ncbi:MAG: PQQ-dependent sugar dehydrogenase [Ignavibacteria bacterium]|nr:PQQ-dependent sugar dehydrogenase [Ignavibacteria bacterium]
MFPKTFLYILFSLLISTCSETKSTSFSLEEAFPNLIFSNPVDLQSSKDGSNRLFVVEQQGRIIVFENNRNTTVKKVFLDIRDRVAWGGEMGLLGLAFHPQFASNGYFYVNYTANNPRRTIISRFRVSATNPDSADKNSEFILLTFAQPYANHNGGCIAFGSDGYLYIATGDGGSAGDPQNFAQRLDNLLGKILRIDVNNPQPPLNYGIPPDNPLVDSVNPNIRKEIYAYGLRNPWKFSFDFQTNKLWAADVGQYDWEEIDLIEKGGNYGWRCYEGNHPYNLAGCNGSYIFPIYEYSHVEGISITGGFVYRGNRFTELYGKYIYGDFGSKKIWALDYEGKKIPINSLIATCPQAISSFGVDDQNELYIVGYEGRIYRLKKTTDVKGNSKNNFNQIKLENIFPNPASEKAFLKFFIPERFNHQENLVLEMFNILGEKIFERKFSNLNSDLIELNLNNFRSGIYLLKTQFGITSTYSRIIITK